MIEGREREETHIVLKLCEQFASETIKLAGLLEPGVLTRQSDHTPLP